jgi:hypothetical protein
MTTKKKPAPKKTAASAAKSKPKKSPPAKATKASPPKGKKNGGKPAPEPKLKLARIAPTAAFEGDPEDLPSALVERRNPLPKESATSRGKYVYCIIRTDQNLKFGSIGIGPEASDVTTVNYRDLAAVVSDTPMVVLDPTRENVLAHQRVNEGVMRDHTVLPMSFGTVFKTRDDIIELLRSAYDAFGDVLNKMQNKFEFGLKVLWDRDQLIREIEVEDEGVRRLKSEISNQKGSTYFARMQYGRMVDAALQAKSEKYVGEIFTLLRDVSVASRSNKPIGDKMIMNAAFLVSRDKEAAFDSKVKAIGSRHGELTFKYTGPWPPYNFVNIRLKLERAAK